MKSYYFDDDEKYSIGTDAKKAHSVATKRITSCSNISWKPIDYDVDGNEIVTGITLDDNGVTLNETVTCGAIVSDNALYIGLLPIVDASPPEGYGVIFINSSDQLCAKKHDGTVKIIASL